MLLDQYTQRCRVGRWHSTSGVPHDWKPCLVTCLPTHHRTFPLCFSVPLCFKPHPSSALRRVWSTQRHRDNRAGTWSCVVAYRQAFAGDPARHSLRLSARLTLLARGDPASQSAAEATLEAVCSLARRWLPKLGILHPSPNERFDAKHPRYEPNTVTLQARICAGGRPKGRFLPRPQYLPLPDWTV